MTTKVSSSVLSTITATQVANNQTYAINVSGTATHAQDITSGSWTISISGTKVYFAYNGTNVFSVDSSGNIIAKGDITGFGTP